MLQQSRISAFALTSSIVLGSLLSVGCGGASPEARSAHKHHHAATVNPFPSREALAKVAAAPVPAAPERTVASSPEWSVEIGHDDAPSPAETRLAKVAARSDAKLTFARELRCVARELGRFQLDHGAQPNERLRRFMIAACGVTNLAVGAMASAGEVSADVTDEALLAQWQKTLVIPKALEGNAVGVWMTRKNKRALIVTAYAKPEGDVVVSPVDASGAFTVRGTAPANTDHVIGLVDQQSLVAHCEPDAATPLPLFGFRCQMAEADKTAWVEVAVRAQGRLLIRSYAVALVRRDPTTPAQFVAASHGASAAATPDGVRTAILEGVNRARAAAKLAPVALAPAQTASSDRLAPQFFAASFSDDQPTGDLVGLGLMAGWDVEGTIKRGNLFSALVSGTSDANEWLDYALETPMGRYTLLRADAGQIAIGVPPVSGVGGVGAVVTTYDLFVGDDHRVDAAHVFAQIAKARAARGLPAPARLEGIGGLALQARLVNQGKVDTEDALDAALIAVRDHAGQSVRGWLLSASDLDALALPPELLGAGPLQVAVEVTHHKEEGAAWGSYVVFVVTPSTGAGAEHTPQIQALRAEAPRRF